VSTHEPRPITVLCADDDSGFRGLLRILIEATPGFALIGEATSGQDAIAAVAAARPDLVLMDVRMPGIDGIETARMLMRRHPDVIIVLMSASEVPPASGIAPPGPSAIFVRKEHLCRQVLLDLWHGRRTCYGRNWVLVRLGDASP
jgi:two-component system invasion response regulator UvrY